jgi:hypothetical protein
MRGGARCGCWVAPVAFASIGVRRGRERGGGVDEGGGQRGCELVGGLGYLPRPSPSLSYSPCLVEGAVRLSWPFRWHLSCADVAFASSPFMVGGQPTWEMGIVGDLPGVRATYPHARRWPRGAGDEGSDGGQWWWWWWEGNNKCDNGCTRFLNLGGASLPIPTVGYIYLSCLTGKAFVAQLARVLLIVSEVLGSILVCCNFYFFFNIVRTL